MFYESFVEFDVFFQIFYINYHQIFSSKKIRTKLSKVWGFLGNKILKEWFDWFGIFTQFSSINFFNDFCSQIFRKNLCNFFEKMWRKKEKQKINEKHIFKTKILCFFVEKKDVFHIVFSKNKFYFVFLKIKKRNSKLKKIIHLSIDILNIQCLKYNLFE